MRLGTTVDLFLDPVAENRKYTENFHAFFSHILRKNLHCCPASMGRAAQERLQGYSLSFLGTGDCGAAVTLVFLRPFSGSTASLGSGGSGTFVPRQGLKNTEYFVHPQGVCRICKPACAGSGCTVFRVSNGRNWAKSLRMPRTHLCGAASSSNNNPEVLIL